MAAGKVGEKAVKFLPVLVDGGQVPVAGAVGNPVGVAAQAAPGGGDRVEDQQIPHRVPLGHHQGDAGEVIVYITVFVPPGGLVVEDRGIVPLPAPGDGVQRQMLAADIDPVDKLPVPHPFLPVKGELPSGAAVGFREHPLLSQLVDHAGALLDGDCLLAALGEHIDAGDGHVAVVGHNGSADLGAQP